jgi:hypothetical protein
MKRFLAVAAECIIAIGLTLALVPPIVRAAHKYGWWWGVLGVVAVVVVGTVLRAGLDLWKISRAKERVIPNQDSAG